MSCSHRCSAVDALYLGRNHGLGVLPSPGLSSVPWSSWDFAPLLMEVKWTLEVSDLSCCSLVSISSTGTCSSPAGPSHPHYKTSALWSPKMQLGKNPQAGMEQQWGFVLDWHPNPQNSDFPQFSASVLFVKWANNITLLMKFLQETFESSSVTRGQKKCPDKVTVSILPSQSSLI